MHLFTFKILFIFIALPLFACEVKDEAKSVHNLKKIFVSSGMACWYGQAFEGRKTSSGQVFRKSKLTAAHRYLQFGTIVKVTNQENKKSVEVEINDRGPVSKNRILDLSEKASKEIDLYRIGRGMVDVEICGYSKVNFEALMKHYKNVITIHQKNGKHCSKSLNTNYQ